MARLSLGRWVVSFVEWLLLVVAMVRQASCEGPENGMEVYVVGAGEYVLGPTAYDFDNPLTWTAMPATDVEHGEEEIVAYSANAYSYMVARGKDLRSGMFKDPVYTGLNGSSNPDDLDHCGAWLNAVHWDGNAELMRGFYHQEWHCNYSHSSYTNMSIAYAESRDRGNTFVKPGHPRNDIITAPNSSATHITGEGGHGMAVRADYFYIYFRDWSTFGIGVARATLSSGGVPGSWYKYYNGEWLQPGIRGNASRIYDVTGTSVYFSSARQQFVSVGDWSSDTTVGQGARLSFSHDAIHWTMMSVPLVPLDRQVWNRTGNQPEQNAYQALAPVMATDDVMEKDFFYSYTYVEPSANRNEKYLCRKEVTAHMLPMSESARNGSRLPPALALVSLAHYRSNETGDIWVTSAAVPPYQGYTDVSDQVRALPYLATADWSLFERKDHRGWHRGTGRPRQSDVDAAALTPDQLQFLCAQPSTERDGGVALQCQRLAAEFEKRESRTGAAMVPIHDCMRSDGDHFVSRSLHCQNQTYVRILGYVAVTQGGPDDLLAGIPLVTAPLYACFDPARNNSCVDATPSCSDCHGNMVGLLGYGYRLPGQKNE